MEATPSFWFGCPDDDGCGIVTFDAHQVWTYAYAEWCVGSLGECGEGLVDLLDLSCWADRPIPGQPASPNEGTPWTDPVTDGAWWYSPSNLASAEFIGLMPTIIDVSRPAALRDYSPVMTGGGIPGRLARPFRTIRIEATAWALSREGLDYGLDVCERAIESAGVGGSGSWLGLRKSCPPTDADLDAGVRFFADVALTGFTVMPVTDEGCCDQMRDVEIVFTVGNQWVHHPPVDSLTVFGSSDSLSDLSEMGLM